MDWPLVELDHVAEMRGGATPRRDNPDYWGGDVPWLTPTDLPAVGDGVTDVQATADAITEAGLASCSASLLPVGTVLFSSRASIGKVGIAVAPLTTNQGFANLIPRRGVESRYLAWCVHFYAGRIAGLAGSTTFKEVSKSALKRFRIPLPAPSEQRRIVEILDDADRLRRLRAEADARTDRILPAFFVKMFRDPATNPKGWPVRSFGSLLLEKPRNGLSPSSGGSVRRRVLTLSAITRDAFDKDAAKEAWFARTPTADKHVDGRDFLVCRGNGNLQLVGRGRFPPQSIPGTVFPDTIIAARVDPDQLDRAYVEAMWATPYFRSQVESKARTTSGIHKINQEIVGALEIHVPPLGLQRRFSKIAQALATAPRNRAGRSLSQLFEVLLHRAFSGRLTRNWREAHMAELLQEMEHQAKVLAAPLRPE